MDLPWSMRILAFLVCGLILMRTMFARRGKEYFIRRIPGIDALEEAVGRATEMGRPVVFTPGIASLDNMQVLAGLAVLGWIARQCAKFMVRVIVPVMEPPVVPAAEEILREAYRSEGKEEFFHHSDVRFLSRDQSAFAAGTIGILTREQAAAGFYFGSFGFESLLIAETGNRIGAIQVAATADYFQIPFFICTCDYTLIGEELYAASAYLSRNPVQVGMLSGQDMAKLLLLVLLFFGSVAAIFYPVLNPLEGLLGW
ncbi:MAG TPA: DUF6754 domain-containing protein [Fimbriimonadales bacterium]|nr:DUF6754 domain-containing protein [Fimbriimonadales bacterium]